MNDLIKKLKEISHDNFDKADGYHSEVYKRYYYGVGDGLFIAIEEINKWMKENQIKN